MTLVAPLRRAEILPVMPDLAFLYIAKKAMYGVVLVNQVRMMDLRLKAGKAYWSAADEVVEEALLRLQAVVE